MLLPKQLHLFVIGKLWFRLGKVHSSKSVGSQKEGLEPELSLSYFQQLIRLVFLRIPKQLYLQEVLGLTSTAG